MTCPECERLRITVERYKLSAGMWRNKCYELGGTPLPWEPEELIKRAIDAERVAFANLCNKHANAYLSEGENEAARAAVVLAVITLEKVQK